MPFNLRENGFDVTRAKAWAKHGFETAFGIFQAGNAYKDVFADAAMVPLQKRVAESLITKELLPAIEKTETAEDLWLALRDFIDRVATSENGAECLLILQYTVGLERYCHANVTGYTEYANMKKTEFTREHGFVPYVG